MTKLHAGGTASFITPVLKLGRSWCVVLIARSDTRGVTGNDSRRVVVVVGNGGFWISGAKQSCEGEALVPLWPVQGHRGHISRSLSGEVPGGIPGSCGRVVGGCCALIILSYSSLRPVLVSPGSRFSPSR